MPRYILNDAARNDWIEAIDIRPSDIGLSPEARPAWSVAKRTLRGGRNDGVETVQVDNGRLSFTVLPTRGMNLWRAHLGRERLGWRSPVRDGPVHPLFVDAGARGGLGWLRGFDELMARCGLESNGPPVFDDRGRLLHGLHGRIANTPAHLVAVQIEDQPPHAITVEGQVAEAELFFSQLRLTTRITTVPGSNRLTVRDEVTNLRDTPDGFQMLYHWNFGPPHLEEGARLVAPVREICPSTPHAAEGIGHWVTYGGPQPGSAEQVYFFALHAGDDGRTAVLLRNRAGDKGVALRFDTRQLPCFTLWKSLQGQGEGYVTGLEPGVNYPNGRAFESEHGRVPALAPGESYVMETVFEALGDAASVAAVEREIAELQGRGAATVHARPAPPFAKG